MNSPVWDLPLLVVDDDAMVRGVVVDYLKDIGFTSILEAKNSQQGLKMIQNSKFPIGLVLSDWEMPGVSGLVLLKALRKNPHRKGTRFVMITSQRSMEKFKITQAAQWKVNAYIIKPFTCAVLREKIWQVMDWEDSDERKISG
ncbi:MAG: response regulator [Bdellovibrionales bacterium]|jgi:two-component system chemotaxis response regulator CheY|nr:response regulator [Bdellovibrionales bacterium]